MNRRFRIYVTGAVQGVGFRPFVFGLATRMNLAGFVLNQPEGVAVEVEGAREHLEAFLRELRTSPPPIARIRQIESVEVEPVGEAGFFIRGSETGGERTVLIAPDVATCADCLREMRDRNDRRYRYPFINCTNCGPRYTIIRDVPYDRSRTTMAEFVMCPACRAEYENPGNRRFHAEPTCCPECGPQVHLLDACGRDGGGGDPIAEALERLAQGGIVAVKGLGGFHLACDACNEEAVSRLRARKCRDAKPFAVMLRDLNAAGRLCRIPPGLDGLLEGPERPIVLLEKGHAAGLAEGVAPRSCTFGVMLPYTPLHHLLMEGPFEALVMTSGNLSDEPIAHTNEEALGRLEELADCFLLHDRGIHIRTDDSVVRPIAGSPRFLRRSRGYAPFPVTLPCGTGGNEILAVGPELNSTICLTRGHEAFLSHHIGDLENVPAYESFLQAIDHLSGILAVQPHLIACDLHPDYLSTRYAEQAGLPTIGVQHHHAHVASVLAEHGHMGRAIGIAFDGMGWGEDGGLWGGEIMICDLAGYERVAHFEPVPQPGGDAAAKRPPRMAYAYLRQTFGKEADAVAAELMPGFAEAEMKVISQMLERRVNCPVTSSVGRLFDGASALLGVCQTNSFHARAPMELEARAGEARDEECFYPAQIETAEAGPWQVKSGDIMRGLVEDIRAGAPAPVCAARFHNALAHVTLDICLRIRENTGLSAVAISGGVFANAFLLNRLTRLLDDRGFTVLLNRLVPAGDGGISLGQAAVAAWRKQCA